MENPILVENYRGETVESFHRGVICLIGKNDEIIFSAGNIEQTCYTRSAVKYFQAIPLIESGAAEKFKLTEKEIAVICASHNGEKIHTDTVRSILQKIGCTEDDLQCGAQLPFLKEDYMLIYQSIGNPRAIQNNCSGKHSGMLALAKFLGASIKDYLNPEHPLQKMIFNVMAEMHEYPKEKIKIAVDGCTAPTFSLPIKNQAIAFRNLVAPDKFSDKRKNACKKIVDAVTKNPYMIAGKNRYCTDMMNLCGKNIIGKTGAEAIYSFAVYPAYSGRAKNPAIGCTIKIDDGKMGVQYSVAQAVIEALNLFPKEKMKPLEKYLQPEIKNHNGIVTGFIRVNEKILKTISST